MHQTELPFFNETCFRSAFEKPLLVRQSVFMMIDNSCTTKTSQYLKEKVEGIPNYRTAADKFRLNPVTQIGEGYKTQMRTRGIGILGFVP